jgi:PPM family protein phosphatase
MLRSYGISEAGAVRSGNEDTLLVDDELGLFVVADGMGGHSAGEVASRTAVESIENFIRRSANCDDFSWPCGIEPSLSYAGNRVRTAIYLANRRVFRTAEEHDDYTGMGTTVVCALISHGRVIVGHVGDSRLYRLSGASLRQETRDDTWANAMLGNAVIVPEALASHPMRHVLTNVVGVRDLAEIHVCEHELLDGDVLLLCSDGIHDAVNADELALLLSRHVDLRECAEAIVSAALDRGSRDNLTAVVIRYSRDLCHG